MWFYRAPQTIPQTVAREENEQEATSCVPEKHEEPPAPPLRKGTGTELRTGGTFSPSRIGARPRIEDEAVQACRGSSSPSLPPCQKGTYPSGTPVTEADKEVPRLPVREGGARNPASPQHLNSVPVPKLRAAQKSACPLSERATRRTGCRRRWGRANSRRRRSPPSRPRRGAGAPSRERPCAHTGWPAPVHPRWPPLPYAGHQAP